MMAFSTPKAVNEIIIYRRLKRESYSYMSTFYVKGYDAKDVMLFLYNDTGEHANKPTVWIPTRVSMLMKRIVICLERADDGHYLELCEVEAFGACGPPDYGLYCDLTCDVRCSGQVCHHNGMCVVCAFGDSDHGGCLSEAPTTIRPNVTKPGALPCTTPLVDMSEDTQLVKLLIVSCIFFAVLVLVLIAYIFKRWQDEQDEVKEPVEEVQPNITLLEDLAQERSEFSQSASSMTWLATREKLAATVKTKISATTNKSAATEMTSVTETTNKSAATEKTTASGSIHIH